MSSSSVAKSPHYSFPAETTDYFSKAKPATNSSSTNTASPPHDARLTQQQQQQHPTHSQKASDTSSVGSDASTLVDDSSFNCKLAPHTHSDNKSLLTLAITEEAEEFSSSDSESTQTAKVPLPVRFRPHHRNVRSESFSARATASCDEAASHTPTNVATPSAPYSSIESRFHFDSRRKSPLHPDSPASSVSSLSSGSSTENGGAGVAAVPSTAPIASTAPTAPTAPTASTAAMAPMAATAHSTTTTPRRSPLLLSLRLKSLMSSSESLPTRVGRLKESRTSLPEGAHIMGGTLCAQYVRSCNKGRYDDFLIVDVRPFQEYCKAHINGAINICLPSTLLRRPNFTLEKCIETLAANEKGLLSDYIRQNEEGHAAVPTSLFYDGATRSMSDASCSVSHLVSKFVKCGRWAADSFVLGGGLKEFEKEHADLVSFGPLPTRTNDATVVPAAELNPQSTSTPVDAHNNTSSVSLSHFTLPEVSHVPFYKMRHQEQIMTAMPDSSLHLATQLDEVQQRSFPKWLVDVFGHDQGASALTRKFNSLQLEERERLNQAMSRSVHAAKGMPADPNVPIVTAGVELGRKNRYKDIFPYEHARVKIRKYEPNEAELDPESSYINASYLTYRESGLNYIATQGPLHETIGDFWRVVCDHNVPIVFSLTAERENQVEKCAPYWHSGTYISNGIEVKVKQVAPDEQIQLAHDCAANTVARLFEVQIGEKPCHQVLQVHLLSWSDYGTSVGAEALLSLVALKRFVLERTHTDACTVLVHCSAGCGRTGCFCAIDTCIDILLKGGGGSSLTPAQDQDLVYDIISNFRSQRVSMVQNLRQYILIYDTIVVFEKKQLLGQQTLPDWETCGIVNRFVERYNAGLI